MKKIVVLLISIFLLSCRSFDYFSFRVYDILDDSWLPSNIISHNVNIEDTMSMYSVLIFVSSIDTNIKNIDMSVSISNDMMNIYQMDTLNVKLGDEMYLTRMAKERKGFFIVMDSVQFKSSGVYTFSFNPINAASISSLGVFLKKENHG